MTIAAGFVCSDGLVLCADTEMTSNIRSSGQKAFFRNDGTSSLAIVGAGDAIMIRLIRNRLFERIDGNTSLRQAESEIEQILRSVFEDHIDRAPDGYDVSVLVGLKKDKEFRLFEHSRTAVADVANYACVGSGSSIANYLAESFFDHTYTVNSACTLASYVLQQCKRFALYCGGESQVITMPASESAAFCSASRIEFSERTVGERFRELVPALKAQLVEAVGLVEGTCVVDAVAAHLSGEPER